MSDKESFQPGNASSRESAQARAWDRLSARGRQSASVEALIDLFNADDEAFFALACFGLEEGAPPWASALAKLAADIRLIVSKPFETISENGVTGLRSSAGHVVLGRIKTSELTTFLQKLSGLSKGGGMGKDYSGRSVSEAEILFKLGDPAGWEADREQSRKRMEAKPVVLRLDNTDRSAVEKGLPAYIAHGLRFNATNLVQAATVVYDGLRAEGYLSRGRAYCGRLESMFDNSGRQHAAPAGMVYVVYVDPDGYVFDWDWVRADPHHPDHPIDSELRFSGNPVDHAPDTILTGVDDVAPGRFNSTKAWHSPRGDCVFYYFSAEPAFAQRINDHLTVFYELKRPEQPTGFKIKNVQQMLGKETVKLEDAAPALTIELHSFLLKTIRENPDTDLQIYTLLISAWWQRIPEPPKVMMHRAMVR